VSDSHHLEGKLVECQTLHLRNSACEMSVIKKRVQVLFLKKMKMEKGRGKIELVQLEIFLVPFREMIFIFSASVKVSSAE